MNHFLTPAFLLVFLSFQLISCSSLQKVLLPASQLTHGPMISEVGPNSAILWGRADGKDYIRFSQIEPKSEKKYSTFATSPFEDFTFSLKLSDLKPNTKYHFEIEMVNANKTIPIHFKTAPKETQTPPLRIAWSGDLAGQNVCRDAKYGYEIFKEIAKVKPTAFIGLGDMIYADNECKAQGLFGNAQIAEEHGPAFTREAFWSHWRYNFADPQFRALLASTPYYSVYDDHEVRNDYGPKDHKAKGVDLMPFGQRTYLDYNPLFSDEHNEAQTYRNYRWGKHLELFFLDTRKFRDANKDLDSDEKPKTLLGVKQLQWFKQSLKKSTAKWKVIISSVPLSLPTGWPEKNGRDGWANYDQQTGFERELIDILRFLKEHNLNKTIWLTTDVHWATGFEYTPFKKDSRFKVYEFIAGPLSANFFPDKRLDYSLNPKKLFSYAPDGINVVKTYTEAKKWFNFGLLEVTPKGLLKFKIINGLGKTVFTKTLR